MIVNIGRRLNATEVILRHWLCSDHKKRNRLGVKVIEGRTLLRKHYSLYDLSRNDSPSVYVQNMPCAGAGAVLFFGGITSDKNQLALVHATFSQSKHGSLLLPVPRISCAALLTWPVLPMAQRAYLLQWVRSDERTIPLCEYMYYMLQYSFSKLVRKQTNVELSKNSVKS